MPAPTRHPTAVPTVDTVSTTVAMMPFSSAPALEADSEDKPRRWRERRAIAAAVAGAVSPKPVVIFVSAKDAPPTALRRVPANARAPALANMSPDCVSLPVGSRNPSPRSPQSRRRSQ